MTWTSKARQTGVPGPGLAGRGMPRCLRCSARYCRRQTTDHPSHAASSYTKPVVEPKTYTSRRSRDEQNALQSHRRASSGLHGQLGQPLLLYCTSKIAPPPPGFVQQNLSLSSVHTPTSSPHTSLLLTGITTSTCVLAQVLALVPDSVRSFPRYCHWWNGLIRQFGFAMCCQDMCAPSAPIQAKWYHTSVHCSTGLRLKCRTSLLPNNSHRQDRNTW